jgi:hypothetical protein
MLVKRAAALERIDNIDLLWQGIVETLNAAGFDHVIYHSVNADFAEPLLRCTIEGLYDGTDPSDDPFLIYACNKYDIVPIGTEFIAGHPYVTDRERDLAEYQRRGARQEGRDERRENTGIRVVDIDPDAHRDEDRQRVDRQREEDGDEKTQAEKAESGRDENGRVSF